MASEPWTIERLRRMTRGEFEQHIKRGDLPPPDVAAAFLKEKLDRAVLRSRSS